MSQLSASITHNDKHNFLINMYRVFAPMSQQLEKACPTTIVSYTNILALMVHDTPVLARRGTATSAVPPDVASCPTIYIDVVWSDR
jgi:hypothetical protein